jgi:hypothetical protein
VFSPYTGEPVGSPRSDMAAINKADNWFSTYSLRDLLSKARQVDSKESGYIDLD